MGSGSGTDSESAVGTDNESVGIEQMEQDWFNEQQLRYQHCRWFRKPNKWVLFAVLFLHTLSFTILMGPLMILMLDKINSGSRNARRMDMGGSGQKQLSNIETALSVISGVLGFALSGKYGQLSDRHGRVHVFRLFGLINLLNISLLIVYFQFMTAFADPKSVLMVLVVSIGYLSGGIMTLISNGASYLNDIIIEPEKRTANITLLMAFVYSALGVGPLLGSLLIRRFSTNFSPLWVALLFSAVSLGLILLILPESKSESSMRYYRSKSSTRGTSGTFSHLLDIKAVIVNRIWKPDDTQPHKRRNIITLLVIDTLAMGATVGIFKVVLMFSIKQYRWTSVEINYYMSLNGFGKTLMLLIFAPVLLYLGTRLGSSTHHSSLDANDRLSLVVSAVFLVVSALSIVVLKSSSGVYLNSLFQCLAGLISPTIQSSIIKYSNHFNSGEMFGIIALIRHLTMLVLPVVFLQLYKLTIDVHPSLVFYIPVVMSVTTLVLASFVLTTAGANSSKETVYGSSNSQERTSQEQLFLSKQV